MTHAISYKVIIRAIIKHKGWDYTTDTQDTMKYIEFENIIVFQEGITSVKRTVREKWKMLIDHGFFKRANQSDTVIVNIDNLYKVIGKRRDCDTEKKDDI